ncbi:hypothetical protein BZA05DRAFT_473922 [Tricharina praecox]|uniref:uncharacterized protein n=1 Tax=Tricharina praecox TaxID=43433 RepID=UPI0022209B88|nr:uncharacterized protein BZA05DRAFT_473922 [Tricharina praecox]KAI5852395.1 hypothetical protein BZA05DRAFT_473922 [Tricharina praecox]
MSAHSSIVSYFEQNVEFTYAARPRANGTDADPDTTILFPKDTLECSISKDSYRGSTYVEDRERSSIYSACSLSKHVDEKKTAEQHTVAAGAGAVGLNFARELIRAMRRPMTGPDTTTQRLYLGSLRQCRIQAIQTTPDPAGSIPDPREVFLAGPSEFVSGVPTDDRPFFERLRNPENGSIFRYDDARGLLLLDHIDPCGYLYYACIPHGHRTHTDRLQWKHTRLPTETTKRHQARFDVARIDEIPPGPHSARVNREYLVCRTASERKESRTLPRWIVDREDTGTGLVRAYFVIHAVDGHVSVERIPAATDATALPGVPPETPVGSALFRLQLLAVC